MIKDLFIGVVSFTIFVLLALVTVYMVAKVYPDYKRKDLVYGIYTECLKNNEKVQCDYILKHKDGGKLF
jgi:hypothetical protein